MINSDNLKEKLINKKKELEIINKNIKNLKIVALIIDIIAFIAMVIVCGASYSNFLTSVLKGSLTYFVGYSLGYICYLKADKLTKETNEKLAHFYEEEIMNNIENEEDIIKLTKILDDSEVNIKYEIYYEKDNIENNNINKNVYEEQNNEIDLEDIQEEKGKSYTKKKKK